VVVEKPKPKPKPEVEIDFSHLKKPKDKSPNEIKVIYDVDNTQAVPPTV
jgi:hypothetical protein